MTNTSPTLSGKDVVRRFSEEIVNKGDFTKLPELVDANVQFDNGVAKVPAGRDGVRAVFAALHTGFRNVACRITNLIEEGDLVAESFTFTGEHTGTFHGIKPTGRRVSMSGMAVFRVVDGKIVSRTGLEDQLGLLHQLGVAPDGRSG